MAHAPLPNFDDRTLVAGRLRGHIVASIEAAPAFDAPFYHLAFNRVFPDDTYASLLANMPKADDYRPMSGRSKLQDLADGTHTRVKIDLFPEYIRHLPPQKRALWNMVGGALCSAEVRDAFVRRLAPALERRFGRDVKTTMYPVPVLTRDIPGYAIPPHTDTHWKGITVQFYLPQDDAIAGVGTIFHDRQADGGCGARAKQMPFAPNSGYAFAVSSDTWHSADQVGPEVNTRDSILLTYFVDSGAVRFLRNRGKRLGNFVLSEARNRLPNARH